jgi:hypothetical protein
MRTSLIRIAMWASVGFLITTGWGLYFASSNKANPIDSTVYALAYVTEPAVWITHSYFDFPRGLRAVEIENTSTFALVGLVLEAIVRRRRGRATV